MARTKTRGGKLLTGIIAFLLGFIFAIIVEVGVIVGAGFVFLNMPIDDLFALVNQKNEDQNGNQYIDTTGEIKTVLQLIQKLQSILGNQPGNATIGSLVKLSPALNAQLHEWYEQAESYGIFIDADKINATTVSGLSDYLIKDLVPSIQPYQVVSAINPDGIGGNELIRSILLGTEAATVTNGKDKYVVYYDEYLPAEDGYVRVVDDKASEEQYPSNLAEGLLTKTNGMIGEQYIYRQYFYFDDSADKYTAVAAEEDGSFVYAANTAQNDYPADYGSELSCYTGNYLTAEDGSYDFLTYTDENGDQQQMVITVGTFTNSPNLDLFTLDFIEVDELLGEYMGDSEVISSLFDGVTLGDLMSGRMEFDARVQQFEITAIVEISPDDEIMAYLGYGITGLRAVTDQEYAYVATHKYTDENEVTHLEDAYVYLDEKGNIDRVTTASGQEIAATKVGEISDKIDGLDVTVVLDISADDAVMAYLGYGITDVLPAGENTYTATYKYTAEDGSSKSVPVTVTTDEKGIITTVVRDDNGQQLLPATIDQLNDRVSGITEALALADFIDVNPSYEGDNGEVTNNNIMLFVGFSATMQPGDLKVDTAGDSYYDGKYYPEDNDNGYQARIYIDDANAAPAEQKVIRVTYTVNGTDWLDGEKVSISDVGSQTSRFTSVLTIGDVIEIEEGDRFMTKLGGYKIENVGDAIDEIWISDAVDIGTDEDIMLYVAFGITDVREVGGEWLATYHSLDGNTQSVKLVLDKDSAGNEIVVGIVGTDGIAIDGTTMSGVGDRVGQLTDDLSITSVVDIEAESSIMMYIGYSVSGITTDGNGVITGNYTYTEGDVEHSVVVTIEKDAQGYASRVYYIENGEQIEVSGTKIADIGTQVDGLTQTLTIGELVEINKDDKILSLVSDSTIDGLSDTIANITVQDMYADEIYGVDENNDGVAEPAKWQQVTPDNFRSSYLYYTLEDGKYVLVNGDGRLDSFDDSMTYYTRGKATGIWYLLLYSNGKEEVYSINKMGEMMENAADNMTSSTLQDFKDAGIITTELSDNPVPVMKYEDGYVLGENEEIKEVNGVSYVVKPLNLCTIDEIIEAVNILAGIINF